MIDILAAALAILGAFFMFTAALGVAIFTDVYARMHCAGKSATLGAALMLSSAALWSGDPGIAFRCLISALFFLLTGPIACHTLARAVCRTDGRLDKGCKPCGDPPAARQDSARLTTD